MNSVNSCSQSSWFRPRADIVVSVVTAAIVVWLNYFGAGMEGLLPNYLDFKRIILAGFDPSVVPNGTPTFPMWGYGWLMLVTENRFALLAIQMTLALIATHVTLHHLETTHRLPSRSIHILRWSVAFALPWYAFHALRWPYSIAVSAFLLSMVCLDRGVGTRRHQIGWIVGSGMMFGILLNFRSDYYLMPVGLAVAIVALGAQRWLALRSATVWLTSIVVMLVPWTIYTWRVTGHPLITSTNAGHVCFIGLGNLPNNKWGITEYDGDPTMHRLIAEHFGKSIPSLVYDSNRFLLDEFKQRVKNDPQEYFRKCCHAAWLIVAEGTYSGEFYRTKPLTASTETDSWLVKKKELMENPFRFFRSQNFTMKCRLALQIVSKILSQLVVCLGYAAFPLIFMYAVRKRDLLSLLFCLAVAYQTTLQIVAYTMPSYTSNMFLVHLLNAVQGGTFLVAWLNERSRSNASSLAVASDPKNVVDRLRRRAA